MAQRALERFNVRGPGIGRGMVDFELGVGLGVGGGLQGGLLRREIRSRERRVALPGDRGEGRGGASFRGGVLCSGRLVSYGADVQGRGCDGVGR